MKENFQGKNQIRKAKRRALDAQDPYRREVRRKIRSGELPRYKVEKKRIVTPVYGLRHDKDGKPELFVRGHKSRTEIKLISTFALLTKEHYVDIESGGLNEKEGG